METEINVIFHDDLFAYKSVIGSSVDIVLLRM